MSCIDLLGNVVWQDADITYYTEGMIHSKVSVIEETILNRKLTAATIGEWTLTDDEQAQIGAYKQVCLEAHAEGVAARADMAQLNLCLDYEAALARLSVPPVTEPETITVVDLDGNATEVPNPAIAADTAERAEAQAVVDNVQESTLELYALRHPAPPEPAPEFESPLLESTNG